MFVTDQDHSSRRNQSKKCHLWRSTSGLSSLCQSLWGWSAWRICSVGCLTFAILFTSRTLLERLFSTAILRYANWTHLTITLMFSLSRFVLFFQAPLHSKEYKLYEEGVRFGCWGMSMYSLSCSCYSLIIEALIKRFRYQPVSIYFNVFFSTNLLTFSPSLSSEPRTSTLVAFSSTQLEWCCWPSPKTNWVWFFFLGPLVSCTRLFSQCPIFWWLGTTPTVW